VPNRTIEGLENERTIAAAFRRKIALQDQSGNHRIPRHRDVGSSALGRTRYALGLISRGQLARVRVPVGRCTIQLAPLDDEEPQGGHQHD